VGHDCSFFPLLFSADLWYLQPQLLAVMARLMPPCHSPLPRGDRYCPCSVLKVTTTPASLAWH